MTSSRQETLRILVVGGGVAGGLVAGWLSQQPGVAVRAVERVSADDHVNAGNGLNLGPNAPRLLSSIWPEKTAELRAASLPWSAWLARWADGSIAYHIPLSEVSPEMGIRIRWSELYRVARSSALPVLAFETDVDAVEPFADESEVRVRERSGGTLSEPADYDYVIVAEGRYAQIREQLSGRPEPQQLGIANFRTLLDDGGRIAVDDMEQWFNGPARIIAARLHDGLIYISGNLPLAPGDPVPEEMKGKAYLRRAYTPSEGPCDPRLAALIEGFCAPESQHHWARAQQIETRWSDLEGRVLYLGDAAHAMAPTLGQGATTAIEDAAAFMRLFATWREDSGARSALPQLSAAFAALRSKRIAFVKHFSEAASDVLLLGSDTEAGLARKRSPSFRRNLIRLYQDLPLDTAHYRDALASAQQLTHR